MAKITINPITSGNNIETAINLRLQQIEDSFNDDVLWRDGFTSEANQMEVDLDMNNNDILNLLELTLGTVQVKSSIETNTADIDDLKDAVNLLWPDKANLPFPGTSLNLRWGQIKGNIADQADLHGHLTTHAAGIATNVADIAALDVRVTQNEADIASNDVDIAALDGRVTTNEGDITALDGRVTVNEGDITALDGRITTNEADIATAQADILTNAGDITTEESARIAEDLTLSKTDGSRAFTGTVSGVTPTADAHLARKDYVDTKAVDEAIAFAIALGG